MNPVWSPDSNKIVFVSDRAFDGSDALNQSRTNNIWVVNADGSGAQPLTRLDRCPPLFNPSGSADSPVWSPDGTKIVFESDRALDGNTCNGSPTENIWVMNADGSSAQPVTKTTAVGNYGAVWSPDGHKILFASQRVFDGSDARLPSQVSNIWVMNSDGSAPTPLTKITAVSADSIGPIWSRDGTKVAFLSARALDGSNAENTNGTENLWVMKSDGSGAIPVTRYTAIFQSGFLNIPPVSVPTWAPDSNILAFISVGALDGSNAQGPSDIWLVHADGSGLAPLTKLTHSTNLSPQWHP